MSQVKLLNPFFSSIFDVLEEMSGEKAERGKLVLQKNKKFSSNGFQVILSINGDVTGQVILDMSKEVAIKLAEIMNMEEIGEFNEMVKSSIKEIGESLSEKANQRLVETKLESQISPPQLLESDSVVIKENVNKAVICAPLKLPFGVDVDKLEPFDALSNDAYNINGFKVTIGKIIPIRDDLAKELIKLKIAS